ncbi:MAG: sporulation protein YunB [Oscillospiraceae bacterium]|nr:sporulation protein YunB [Oscillospiraceae bacterium]
MRLEIRGKKRKRQTFPKRLFALSFILVFLILLSLFLLLRIKNSSLLREVAQSEIESIAFDIVGRTVEEELLRGGEEYTDFVRIERDSAGKVSAITTDMQKLNLLKLRVINKLSEEMFERTEDTVYVPLGNLTGIDFLTGMGPKIKFKIMWVSSVDGEFSNSFTEAGINQTNHRIMLDFTINAGMMFIGREVGVDVGVSVCVAETVIVGEIPKYFSDK